MGPKHRRPRENLLKGIVIALALLALSVSSILKVTFLQGLIVVLATLAIGFIVSNNVKFEAERKAIITRRRELIEKYQDESLVNAIINKELSQGMAGEVVLSMFGLPTDIDNKIFKDKRSVTLKYGQTGVNRFLLRVHLENDVVVGWDTPQIVR